MNPVIFPEESHLFQSAGICHSSCLLESRAGDLYLVWYQGSCERADDVRLMMSMRPDGSTVWRKPEMIPTSLPYSHANPVLLEREEGYLELIYSVLLGKNWADARLMVQVSNDGGTCWSKPEPVPQMDGWLVRNKSLTLQNDRPGRVVLPVYDERTWSSAILFRDPCWSDWKLSQAIPSPMRLIQPTVIENEDGHLIVYMRSDHDSTWMWQSRSRDGGETWSDATPVHLPNNNSSVDALRLTTGGYVMAFNDSTGPRTPLSLCHGEEALFTCAQIRHIESNHGDFSYPCLVQGKNRRLYLSYTHQKEAIKFVSLDREWITRRPDRLSRVGPGSGDFPDWVSPYHGSQPLSSLYLDLVEIDGALFAYLYERDVLRTGRSTCRFPMSARAGKNADCVALALFDGEHYLGALYAQNARRECENHLNVLSVSMHPLALDRGLERLLLLKSLLVLCQRFSIKLLNLECSDWKVPMPDPDRSNAFTRPTPTLIERWKQMNREQEGQVFRALIKQPIQVRDLVRGIDMPAVPSHEVSVGYRSENILSLPKRRRIQEFAGIHRGKRCFILASGPSINDVPLERLQGEIVIALNRSLRLYPDADYTCTMAEHAFVAFGELLRSARLLFTTGGRPFGIPIKTLGIRGFSFDLEKGLYTGQTVSIVALQLAVYMGFESIHFVGLDLQNVGGNTHFFGKDPVNENHDRTEFPRMKRAFEQIMPLLDQRRIRVTNCSSICDLTCLPFVEFDRVVPPSRSVLRAPSGGIHASV